MTTVRACANIALVKYWGKRDAELNLPAAGSLSLTLDALVTETTVTFDLASSVDTLQLDGKPGDATRVSPFLDLVRKLAGIETRARVISENRFPTASGLASSASGFAALAMAASKAAGLSLSPRELSILARQGSGSAARSIFTGFVRMYAGDGTSDSSYAEPRASALTDRVRMVIAIVGGGAPKTHGSRDAMEHCAETSPLYRGWIACVDPDLEAAERHLAAGDLQALGELAEANALAMHAAAIASRPAIIYWRPETLALLQVVRDLRKSGIGAWGTMDAGPHVKVLCDARDADTVATAVRAVASSVIISGVGAGAAVV